MISLLPGHGPADKPERQMTLSCTLVCSYKLLLPQGRSKLQQPPRGSQQAFCALPGDCLMTTEEARQRSQPNDCTLRPASWATGRYG